MSTPRPDSNVDFVNLWGGSGVSFPFLLRPGRNCGCHPALSSSRLRTGQGVELFRGGRLRLRQWFKLPDVLLDGFEATFDLSCLAVEVECSEVLSLRRPAVACTGGAAAASAACSPVVPCGHRWLLQSGLLAYRPPVRRFAKHGMAEAPNAQQPPKPTNTRHCCCVAVRAFRPEIGKSSPTSGGDASCDGPVNSGHWCFRGTNPLILS